MKTWRVSDPATCNEEDFDSEEEALAYARELLKGHRNEALTEGEWPSEVEELKVFKLTHAVMVSKSGTDEQGFDWADYEVNEVK